VFLATNTFLDVHDFAEAVAEINVDEYSALCGADVTPLTFVANYVHEQMHILASSALDLQEFFQCSNIFPLIELVTFDGTFKGENGRFLSLLTFL